MKKNLILLGMMAVGKTTVGKIVAKKQKLAFVDIDKLIEKENLMTISEIFKKKGEKFFRMEEEKEVLKFSNKSDHVIALGGGAFMNKTIRNYVLKSPQKENINCKVKFIKSIYGKAKLMATNHLIDLHKKKGARIIF